MSETLYRRPLPDSTVAFSSPAGRALFAEALAAGGMEGYFPLAEQFHTQADPSFCGLGSLVMALNALGVDPGRLWKGPWRWFAEDLLDCCVPLEQVRQRGLDLDELACLARCNGAEVELHRAERDGVEAWRAALALAARGEAVVIASYDRRGLDQTGSGHFSPIGGYHAAQDLALVLDVARFKYPPHWVAAERLWTAMGPIDPATGRSRGWMILRRRSPGVAFAFSLRCSGDGWQGLVDRLRATIAAVPPDAGLDALAAAFAPLVAHLELRTPANDSHRQLVERLVSQVRSLSSHADLVTLLLLALREHLPDGTGELGALAAEAERDPSLAAELTNLRAQLAALWTLKAS